MSNRVRRSKRRLQTASFSVGKATRRIGLAVGLMFCGSAVSAQQPSGSSWNPGRQPIDAATRVTANKPASASTMKLQPVARFGEERPTRQHESSSVDSRPGWQLRWRKPNQANQANQPIRETVSTATEGVTPAAAVESNNLQSRVLQAVFQDRGEQTSPLELPETLDLPPNGDADDPSNADIFDKPFDNFPPSPSTPPRSEQPDESERAPAPEPPNTVDPASPSDLGPVPDNSMRSEAEPLDDPKYRANPFPQADERRDETEATDRDDRRSGQEATEGLVPSRRGTYSCDDLRDRLDARTIDKVSLDISPPFRPDMIDEETFQRARTRFEEKQEIREWRSIDGAVMAKGRLTDLAYEHAVIDAEHGGTEKLPMERISEADLAYISENWGLPQECRIKQVAYEPRQWIPSEVTWKASALCHKPLYFEEVNLERYGHTAGPFAQPLISSAHFFLNIAVLPYKAGIHPPTECQYSLGYYRPGSCAPWIVPPVPISLRGAVTQATVVASGIAWIP